MGCTLFFVGIGLAIYFAMIAAEATKILILEGIHRYHEWKLNRLEDRLYDEIVKEGKLNEDL